MEDYFSAIDIVLRTISFMSTSVSGCESGETTETQSVQKVPLSPGGRTAHDITIHHRSQEGTYQRLRWISTSRRQRAMTSALGCHRGQYRALNICLLTASQHLTSGRCTLVLEAMLIHTHRLPILLFFNVFLKLFTGASTAYWAACGNLSVCAFARVCAYPPVLIFFLKI